MFKNLLLVSWFVLSSFHSALAAERVGLVIGNDNYTHVSVLQKARSDAKAISDTLSAVGFEITRVLDADRRAMNLAISTFIAKLQPGDTALVFFAGHGVEIDGQNYLLPTNIESPANANEDFIKSESIELSNVLQRVQSTGARITLMFIDACRDNPFAGSTGRSIGGTRGLARITAPEGTFVVFSAGARQQALDRLNGEDANPNSVFTRTLLPKLKEPDLELRQLVSKVRLEVRDLALKQNHRQFPAYYDELLGKFYFNPNNNPDISEPEASADAQPTTAGDAELQADFERVRTLDSAVAYEAFLAKHAGKTDLLIDIAKLQLKQLQAKAAVIKSETPKEPEIKKEVREDLRQLPDKSDKDNRKEIIRVSQKRLNALGCEVGAADGVSGPRTQRAFRQFIANTGVDLHLTDFGSQLALTKLNEARGAVCEKVAVKPAPAKRLEPVQSEQEVVLVELPEPPKPTSLAGTWSFKARCPLAIRARGTTTYSSLGDNVYASVTRDNFGNLGSGRVIDQGDGRLAVNLVWQDGAKDIYTAKISADRRTITGKNYAGCRFTAQKNN